MKSYDNFLNYILIIKNGFCVWNDILKCGIYFYIGIYVIVKFIKFKM